MVRLRGGARVGALARPREGALAVVARCSRQVAGHGAIVEGELDAASLAVFVEEGADGEVGAEGERDAVADAEKGVEPKPEAPAAARQRQAAGAGRTAVIARRDARLKKVAEKVNKKLAGSRSRGELVPPA